MTLTRATSSAFAAAFFLLPLSKSATFVALGVAATLLALSMRREAGTVERRPPPGWGAITVLAVLPFTSLLVHPEGAGNLHYLSQGYYWLLAVLVFAGARRADVSGWLAAFVGGTLLAWTHLRLQPLGIRLLPAQPAALGNHILASQFLALGLVAAAMLHRHEPRPAARAVCWVIVAAMGWGIATGEGRTGALAVLALLPLVASAMLPRRGRAALALACALGAAALLASPTVQTRIGLAISDVASWRTGDDAALARIPDNPEGRQNSIGLRLEMWRTAGAILAAQPLLGGGPQAFQRAWWQRFEDPSVRFAEPHNAYLFYAAAYGLPGLLALLAFLVATVRTGWRHRTRLAGGTTLGFGLAAAIAGLTNTLVLGTTSMQLLVMFAGLAGALWPARPSR
jgi:O-antigen ligase